MARETSKSRTYSTAWTPSASSSSTASHLSHPLYDGDGDDGLLELPPRAQLDLVAQVNATVDSVLDMMIGGRPWDAFWRPKGVKKDVAYYLDDNVDPDQYRFCCVSETTTRTEDIIKLFLAADSETLLKNNRVVYNNILETRVLSVLEKPSRRNPFKSVYLRYSSFATPKLMDDRDMCVVVATDVFTHDDGSTIGYCLFDSVDIPECPDYGKSHGLVRSRVFRSGFFCHTTNADPDTIDGGKITKIVYLVGLEAGGAAPRLTAWLVMDKFGATLERLCSYFRRKHLDPSTFRPRSEWASARASRQCRGCIKTFGSFTTRHNCAACGEVFCKACYSSESVDIPGMGITPVRLCFHCLDVRGIDRRMTRVGESPRTSEHNSRRRTATHAGSTASLYSTMPLSRAPAMSRLQDDGRPVSRPHSSSTFASSSSSVRLMSR